MNGSEQPVNGPSPVPRLPVEEHLDRLFAYAYRLTGSQDLAEDLTQQTFLVAQQRIHQLRDPDRLAAWLMKILRNAYLKYRRGLKPLAARPLELAADQLVCEQTPHAIYDEELLHAALQRLPEEFRVVVLMFYFEGLSYCEIAKELALPEGTVMSRLSRAKGHLRRMLFTPERLTS
jgi:RNA polymerase sigma-70 factor (ECF subfamily)